MGTRPAVKEFSAERQIRLGRAGARPDGDSGQTQFALEALRGEIATLAEKVDRLTEGPKPEDPGGDESVAARIEIAQMVRVIGQAKMEIAAIKHPKTDDDRMLAATGELDAIVRATEASTEDILAAAETIEGMIRKISGACHGDREITDLTDGVAEQIIKIFEACNFQDITGQRITKVVNTISFIEERVLAMIAIWGVEAFSELPIPEEQSNDGDDGLMNGPQLPTQGISQEDINALFD